jgi:hypothetical protein
VSSAGVGYEWPLYDVVEALRHAEHDDRGDENHYHRNGPTGDDREVDE